MLSKTRREHRIGKPEFNLIMNIIQDYFDGLYDADTEKLRKLFHPDAFLKAPDLRRSLENWLHTVASRPKPAEQKQDYGFKILSIEVVKDQAMVKVDVPLFEFRYIDYLGLLKEKDNWLIVNKMYTDTREH